jgi:peptidyl-prolyl cis-trans isomerase SurA
LEDRRTRAREIVFCCLLTITLVMTAGCGTTTVVKNVSNATPAVQPSPDTGAAAAVNGVAVPITAVNEQLIRLEAQEKTQLNEAPEAGQGTLRKQVIDLLIDDELYRQAAKSFKLSVSEKEIDAAVTAARSQFTSKAEYDAAIKAAGMTDATYRDYTRQTLLTQKVDAKVIAAKLVTAAEAESFYNANPSQFTAFAGKTFAQLDQAARDDAFARAWLAKTRQAATIKIF